MRRLTIVWLALAVVTIASWWLGSHRDPAASSFALSATVLAFAFVKTRFVIRDFMEVRHAARWLQIACDAWLIALPAAILSVFWFSR